MVTVLVHAMAPGKPEEVENGAAWAVPVYVEYEDGTTGEDIVYVGNLDSVRVMEKHFSDPKSAMTPIELEL